MHRIRLLLGLGLLAGVQFTGCSWLEKDVRPKPPPHEFRAPPEDDPRFGMPHEYPKEAMEQDDLLKKAKDSAKGLPGPMNSPRNSLGRSPGGF